ncbi:DUF1450 domain-containing protein [Paenibacillus shunpengii]|uniref:DUF1450 domain-containing protein n=1 Tax=Paenibacillus shunpengii TaxID=2054424 RepID=A0ABW5SQ05_9BACL|nr:DUF1450 domain-containing protein [Paenibacillus sp. PDC88]OMC65445.1 hypothetical protein BK126_22355 [Paenibacillus sp. FSL H7-0326]SDX19978.1 Uncharacterized protein YuzB, UPF0349 family [Paenibacillus sp. PDC88]
MESRRLEFCAGNTMRHELYDNLLKLKDKQYDVRVNGCMGRCRECREQPFALLDGQVIALEKGEA